MRRARTAHTSLPPPSAVRKRRSANSGSEGQAFALQGACLQSKAPGRRAARFSECYCTASAAGGEWWVRWQQKAAGRLARCRTMVIARSAVEVRREKMISRKQLSSLPFASGQRSICRMRGGCRALQVCTVHHIAGSVSPACHPRSGRRAVEVFSCDDEEQAGRQDTAERRPRCGLVGGGGQ